MPPNAQVGLEARVFSSSSDYYSIYPRLLYSGYLQLTPLPSATDTKPLSKSNVPPHRCHWWVRPLATAVTGGVGSGAGWRSAGGELLLTNIHQPQNLVPRR